MIRTEGRKSLNQRLFYKQLTVSAIIYPA